MGKHSQDNDEDGYWPKPVPKEDPNVGGGKHDSGKQQDQEDGKDDEDQ